MLNKSQKLNQLFGLLCEIQKKLAWCNARGEKIFKSIYEQELKNTLVEIHNLENSKEEFKNVFVK